MAVNELPEFLETGEEARLIPVVSETSKERRAASIFLATLTAVDDFAASMLRGIGVRVGTRAKLRCFTEVVFRDLPVEVKHRPDGLVLVNTGKKVWSAIVEAKIGKAEIDEEQLKNYVQLAKQNGIDAVITLSNQFTALPDHHPVPLPKTLTKGVEVFHWSWMYMLTQATLLLHDDQFSSPEQRYILREVVRFFSHDSAGVSQFDRMNAEWKDLVLKIQSDAPLNRALPEVERSVASWHQEERDLSLIMSRKIGREVHLKLSRAHLGDQAQRLRDDCEELVQTKTLSSTLEIPDAAAPLLVTVHLGRRTITCSMSLQAPKDKKRASARINWLLRQLAQANAADVFVKANWPGRAQDTHASLEQARTNPASLESANAEQSPLGFEVMMVRDLAGKFAGTKTFIEGLEDFVPKYYENIGQYLRAWVAAPPKVIQPVQSETLADPKGLLATAGVTSEEITGHSASLGLPDAQDDTEGGPNEPAPGVS